MQTKQLWAASLLSTLLLSACQVDDLPGPDSGELYTRDFIKTFGLFDSRHDWNLASAATVTVTTDTPTDISVCARIDGTLYEFATFLRVNGSKTLDVNIPKGTSQLIVRAGGRDYNVAVGGSIDLASRSYYEAEAAPGTLGVRRAKGIYDIVKYGSYVAKYADILPEGKGNLNRENISLNFRFKQLDDQEIVIYPVLWNTRHINTLGIYYTDADGVYHEQNIYTIKDGDFLRRRSYSPTDDVMDSEDWISSFPRLVAALKELGLDTGMTEFTPEQKAQVLQKLVELGWRATGDDLSLNPQPPTLYLPGDTYEGVKLAQNRVRIKGTRWTWASMQNTQTTLDASQHNNEHTIYETSGIVVTIPKGVEYGMFIRRDDGEIRYSESSKNPKSINYYYKYDGDPSTDPEKVMLDYYYHCPYAATFTREDLVDYGSEDQVSTFRRVCFEDWLASEKNSDHDLNDMVFYIGGVKDEEVIEGDTPQEEAIPYTWIIACEDLGDNDFDFNDVVFGVSNPRTDADGNRTVKIRPMAAGGTLPLYLCYDGKRIVPEGNTANGEFHSWFRGNHTSSTVINAGGYSAIGQSVTLQVKPDFTLACCLNVEGGNMGGFTVEVEGTDHRVITAPDLEASISEAPQMICVPVTWFWPTERTHILEPYPKFKDWCADMNTHTEWHKVAESGNVVRHNYASSGAESPDPGPTGNVLTLTSTGNTVWSGDEYKVEIPTSIDLSNATSLIFKFSGLQSGTYANSFWSENGQDAISQLHFYGGTTTLTLTDADVISRLAQNRTFYYVFWKLTDTPTITIEVDQ